MNMPFVSVLMPVYNAENYLREAIESILVQTYENFEFIIINDGSTDKTLDIIREYKDKRIKVLSNEQNRGIVYTLNRGLDSCRGKYAIRMDSDDISLPDRIEKQVGFMENHPDIDISSGLVKGFGVNVQREYLPAITSDEIKCALLFDAAMPHPAVIMRMDTINKYHLRYPDYIAEDYMMWVTALEHCKFQNIPEVLLNYRITGSSLTAAMNKKQLLKKETFMQAYDIMLRRCGLSSSIENRTLQYYFNSGRLEYEDIRKLKQHLKSIIKANTESHYYDDRALKNIIGKRWIAYTKRNKQYKNIISIFTLYGIKYIIARLFHNHFKG